MTQVLSTSEISRPITSGTIIKETVVSDLMVPWDLTFTPSGTLYFTERRGEIKKVVDGNVITISHPLNVHSETEAGLMGIVFDPTILKTLMSIPVIAIAQQRGLKTVYPA